MADNIAEPSFNDVAAASQTPPQQTQQTQPDQVQASGSKLDFMNVQQALGEISKYYDRSFKNLNFVPSSQLIDGCSVEFVDPVMKATIATARIRSRNMAVIDQATGELYLKASLSDLTFGSAPVNVITTPQK